MKKRKNNQLLRYHAPTIEVAFVELESTIAGSIMVRSEEGSVSDTINDGGELTLNGDGDVSSNVDILW